MQRSYLLLILLISIESISSDKVICDNPTNTSERLKYDCTNGVVSASIDNLGNVPDSCCKVYIYEGESDGYGGVNTDTEQYCLQIKKSRASDYINYIKEMTYIDPDYISITCGEEKVTEWDRWDRFSRAFSTYIRTFNLGILFLFLLF